MLGFVGDVLADWFVLELIDRAPRPWRYAIYGLFSIILLAVILWLVFT